MSFDSFKSSTVGPEALAARTEHEKRIKEQSRVDRANRERDKERREFNLKAAIEDSKNYEMPEDSNGGNGPAFTIPKLSRGKTVANPAEEKFKIASGALNAQATVPADKNANGFKLKRF